MSMNHGEAEASNAAGRYLLGEMNEPERFAFEAHYFECETCAEEVRAGADFAHGIKSVFAGERQPRQRTAVIAQQPRRRRFEGLSAASLLPAAAALVFGVFAGYQAMVTIPAARQDAETRVSAPVVLHGEARGSELPVVVMHRGQPAPPLWMDVNAAAPGVPLVCEVSDPSGAVRIRKDTVAPPAGAPLIVVLESAVIRRAGTWAVQLRTAQGADAGHYSFSIQSD